MGLETKVPIFSISIFSSIFFICVSSTCSKPKAQLVSGQIYYIYSRHFAILLTLNNLARLIGFRWLLITSNIKNIWIFLQIVFYFSNGANLRLLGCVSVDCLLCCWKLCWLLY